MTDYPFIGLKEVSREGEAFHFKERYPYREDEQFHYVGSAAKLRSATGWVPRIGLEEGLRLLLESVLSPHAT